MTTPLSLSGGQPEACFPHAMKNLTTTSATGLVPHPYLVGYPLTMWELYIARLPYTSTMSVALKGASMKRRLSHCPHLVFPFGSACVPNQGSPCKHIQKAAVSVTKAPRSRSTSLTISRAVGQIIKTYKKANKKITNKSQGCLHLLLKTLKASRRYEVARRFDEIGPDPADMSNHGKALNDLG